MTIEFAHPRLLLLLWAIPLIALWWHSARRAGDRAMDRFVSPAMRTRLMPALHSRRFAWQMGLALAGLTLCLVASARPRWGEREEHVFQRGRDLIIALDVSRSMLVADVHPNRLQRAKTDLLDLIRELEGDRAGLLAFRQKATLLCPLTTDYAFLRHALDGTGPNSAPPGETDIGDAIQKALDAFDPGESSHKAIILISDGEDLGGQALDAASRAAEMGIVIFTVGIGSGAGGNVPGLDKAGEFIQHGGQPVVSRLDEGNLKSIAETSRGVYIPIGTASTATTTLGGLYRDHLRRMDARDIEERLQRRMIERYQLFLFPGIFLLLACVCLSRGRLAVGRPRPAHPATSPGLKAVALAILLGSSAITLADDAGTAPTNTPAPVARAIPPGRAGARLAQDLYRSGDYLPAAEAYLEAAKNAPPAARDDILHNAAVALYQAGQYQRAADVLKTVDRERSKHEARTTAALGATLFKAAETNAGEEAHSPAEREALLRAAGDAFRRAARTADEAQAEAQRRNLAITTDRIESAAEEAQITALLERYGKTSPDDLLRQMLLEQREINKAVTAAATNSGPERLYALEALAERQRVNADRWVPLKGKLLDALLSQPGVTNAQEQAAHMAQAVEATRDRMKDSVAKLRDLDPDAEALTRQTEKIVYQFWRPMAPYEPLLAEAIFRQTNVIAMAASPARASLLPDEQAEALALTTDFRDRFIQAVPKEGLPAGSPGPAAGDEATSVTGDPTNAAPDDDEMTSERRTQILKLTDEAMAAQRGALEAWKLNHPPESGILQREAYRLLKEIESLLPKSKSEQQQQQEQQQENQQDTQESQSEESQKPPKPPDQAEQPQPSGEPQKPEDDGKAPPPPEEPLPEDLERMLQRALQREREHQEDVQRRELQHRSRPDERDW